MKVVQCVMLIVLASWAAAAVWAEDESTEIKKGDKLQALSNLHPDYAKRLLYTMNYQLEGVIPVCSEITVKKISGKRMVFDYEGLEYMMDYEKYTKGAGVSFQKAVQTFFGPKCDKEKMASLSKVDQEGIKNGKPQIGMTKDGILFTMGRPPYHANPSLENQNLWMYWRNRFARTSVRFDADGKVDEIK